VSSATSWLDVGKAPAGGVSAGESDADVKRGAGFRPDIQGLRALAVAMVVIYHLYPSALPGGFAGVDVFFVISGFLITRQLWRGYQETGRISLVGFWGRRARRLVPAAALVLAATWVGARIVLPASVLQDTAAQIRASALYYQNWQLASDAVNYFKSADAASPVQHFWSLSVEEQFYIVWPVLFLLAALVATLGKSRHGRRAAARLPAARNGVGRPGAGRPGAAACLTILVLTLVLVAGSLAYSIDDSRADPAAAYFVTTTRMWELGAGGLLALMPARLSGIIARQAWLGWTGLAGVIASPFVLRGTAGFPGAVALLPVLAAGAFIAGPGRGRFGPARFGPARLMSAPPLVFLGGISYSLYLWHWPLIVLWTSHSGHAVGAVAGPGIAVVSITLAWLTKILIEDRVRLSPLLAGHGWRSLCTVLAAVVPVTLATIYLAGLPSPDVGRLSPDYYPGAALLAGKAHNPPRMPVLPSPAVAAVPGYWQQGCLDGEEASVPKTCVFGDTTHPKLTVALVGDSIAGNWWGPLSQIASQEHWKLVTELHGTCLWTATLLVDPNTVGNKPYPACQAWGASVLHEFVTNIHPDLVITSGSAQMMAAARPRNDARSRAGVGAGMAMYWKKLQAHGIPVIAIRSTPLLSFSARDCVAKSGATAPRCDTPRSKAVVQDQPFDFAARLMKGRVKVIDMNSLICRPHDCPPVIGNVLVYGDYHHLTPSYGRTLAPFLMQRLLRASPLLAAAVG
jgi:peptidoglycan/LPS O-acetylase OafA/YrhL